MPGLRSFVCLVAFLLVGSITYWTLVDSDAPSTADEGALAEELVIEEPEPALDAFGIEEGMFTVEEKQIRRNQTFSDLLAPHGVSHATIARVAEESRSVFDVRRLRAGQPLHVYSEDSTGTAQVVVYEIDPVNYVVFDLQDSIRIERNEREVVTRKQSVEGEITNSPYMTLVEQGANPHLAAMLSEVFAWQVDFYRIRQGDSFNIVYEERFVDDEPVGLGRILAAEFTHRGSSMQAYYFEHEDERGYFDEEGNSLRKAFLQAPLRYQRISSRYSRNRFHPILRENRPHLGTDYAAPTGTPIRATGDGVVAEARYTRGNGNYIKIRHNSVYETQYLHMSGFAGGIREGTRVEQGDVIGYVGQTGLATGPHLCYRFWKNGQQVDPYALEFPSSEPVSEEYFAAFEATRDELQVYLNGLPAHGPALADTGDDDDESAL